MKNYALIYKTQYHIEGETISVKYDPVEIVEVPSDMKDKFSNEKYTNIISIEDVFNCINNQEKYCFDVIGTEEEIKYESVALLNQNKDISIEEALKVYFNKIKDTSVYSEYNKATKQIFNYNFFNIDKGNISVRYTGPNNYYYNQLPHDPIEDNKYAIVYKIELKTTNPVTYAYIPCDIVEVKENGEIYLNEKYGELHDCFDSKIYNVEDLSNKEQYGIKDVFTGRQIINECLNNLDSDQNIKLPEAVNEYYRANKIYGMIASLKKGMNHIIITPLQMQAKLGQINKKKDQKYGIVYIMGKMDDGTVSFEACNLVKVQQKDKYYYTKEYGELGLVTQPEHYEKSCGCCLAPRLYNEEEIIALSKEWYPEFPKMNKETAFQLFLREFMQEEIVGEMVDNQMELSVNRNEEAINEESLDEMKGKICHIDPDKIDELNKIGRRATHKDLVDLIKSATKKEFDEKLQTIIDSKIDAGSEPLAIFISISDLEAIQKMTDFNEQLSYIYKILEQVCEIQDIEIPSFEEIRINENKNLFQAEEDEGNLLPKEIKMTQKISKAFDKRIIGQDNAKEVALNTILYNELTPHTENKQIGLFIGPTGSGKTLIARTAAQAAGKGMMIIDANQLSQPGLVGTDITTYFEELYKRCNDDLEKAESSIVVIDEVDKLVASKNSQTLGKEVLNSLLGILEGTSLVLFKNEIRRKPVVFNTNKLTFFLTGSFAKLVELKKGNGEDYKNTRIGFTGTLIKTPFNNNQEYPKITNEDLIKYGNLTKEIVGRIPSIIQLKELTKETLHKILTESDLSPIKDAEKVFEKIMIKLDYTEEYLDAVCDKALKLNQGARGLNSVVKESIQKAMNYVALHYGKYSEIHLTKETVDDNTKYGYTEYENINEQGVKKLVKTK